MTPKSNAQGHISQTTQRKRILCGTRDTEAGRFGTCVKQNESNVRCVSSKQGILPA